MGYSNLSAREFLELLSVYNITKIADVRRFPEIGREEFRIENLRQLLGFSGIGYVWVEELGGYRKGGYREYMKSVEFDRGIKKLIKEVKEENVAVMCSEKMWFRCHRRFISDRLTEMGYTVYHIIDRKRFYPHTLRKV